MSLLDQISKKLTDAGQTTLQKTKNLAEIAKMNGQISDEEKKITKFYEEIGKKYYNRYKNEQDAEFVELMTRIKEAEQTIVQCKQNIVDLKGFIPCPSCGKDVDSSITFCCYCGTKIESPQEVELEICKNCGETLVKGNRFCTSCGCAIDNKQEE